MLQLITLLPISPPDSLKICIFTIASFEKYKHYEEVKAHFLKTITVNDQGMAKDNDPRKKRRWKWEMQKETQNIKQDVKK